MPIVELFDGLANEGGRQTRRVALNRLRSVHPVPRDIREDESPEAYRQALREFFSANPPYHLHTQLVQREASASGNDTVRGSPVMRALM
jgi:hypothetical protein